MLNQARLGRPQVNVPIDTAQEQLEVAGGTVIRIAWRQLTMRPQEVIAAVAGAAIRSLHGRANLT